MRKANLVISLAFMLVLFSFPMILGAQNSITNVAGNNSVLYFELTTTQITTNPGIGDNVTYRTEVNVTSGDATYNLSSFYFNLPDNSSTQVAQISH